MGVKTICYLSFGYPSIEGSIEAAGYYVEGGADAIEVSLPPHNPYRDSAFIQGLYKVALEQTENYDDYLDGIARMIKKYPNVEIILILYHEVFMAIGAKKVIDFCHENGIGNLISGDLHDEDALKALKEGGIKLARSVNYKMNEDDIQRCINTDGFTYMQAFPSEGQYVKPGFEELDTCIRYLRERKVSEPIYCGAGIKCPADAAKVKAAGGNGFFVGSSIIKMYDEPDKLIALIKEYKKAVSD
ncbi:MAG: tryptophan synthase subunit alpha [Oscillospiraceae bacterium]|nr:tryptophan synthase subunit alpha [Oscillospiraceae bacterium]